MKTNFNLNRLTLFPLTSRRTNTPTRLLFALFQVSHGSLPPRVDVLESIKNKRNKFLCVHTCTCVWTKGPIVNLYPVTNENSFEKESKEGV